MPIAPAVSRLLVDGVGSPTGMTGAEQAAPGNRPEHDASGDEAEPSRRSGHEGVALGRASDGAIASVQLTCKCGLTSPTALRYHTCTATGVPSTLHPGRW
jgi:hypothetical protein